MDEDDIKDLLLWSNNVVSQYLKVPAKKIQIDNISYVQKEEIGPRFAGFLKDNILLLNTKYNLDKIIKGIVLREVFLQYLPSFCKNIPSTADLGNEFARIHLSEVESKYWHELWKLHSKRFTDGYVEYDAPQKFPLYNKYTANKFVQIVFESLNKYSEMCNTLDEVNYYRFIDEIIYEIPPRVSPSELKILDNIDYTQEIDIDHLLLTTGLAKRTIFSAISRLKAKGLLIEKPVYISQKFNMPIFYVIFQRKRTELIHPSEIFVGNPFLWAYWPIISHAGGIIAVFELYNRNRSLREFNHMLSKLRDYYNIISLQRRSYSIHTNFAILKLIKDKWDFNWAIWLKQAQRAAKCKFNFPQYSIYISTTLSKKYIYIANELLKENSTISEIAKNLKLSQSEVRSIKRELYHFGYVKDYTILGNLGLHDTLYLLIRGPISKQKGVLNGLRKLPLIYIISDNENSTLVRIKIPYGTSIKIGDMLRIYLQDFEDLSFSIYFVGRKMEFFRNLPVEYWDTINQEFKHPPTWNDWYNQFESYFSFYQ